MKFVWSDSHVVFVCSSIRNLGLSLRHSRMVNNYLPIGVRVESDPVIIKHEVINISLGINLRLCYIIKRILFLYVLFILFD